MIRSSFFCKSGFYMLMFTGILMINYASTYAQSDAAGQNLKHNLRMISNEMFNAGNSGFIIVEALSDSLIRDNSHFTFDYSIGHIAVNGKVLPEPLQHKYSSLMEDFFTKDPSRRKTSMLYMASDGIRMNEVLDPSSKFRNLEPSHEDYSSVIINEMAAEKVIDTNRTTKIIYTPKGIFVDGHRLSEALETKYKNRFKELDFQIPLKGGDKISIEHIPDAPGDNKKN